MKHFVITLFAFLCLTGCKTKQTSLSTTETLPAINKQLTSEAILLKHRQNSPTFESLSAAMQVEISNSKKTQTLPFSLRMKKDEKIWLSAPLGLAKILLTPSKVQFYNKLDKTYYEGNYEVSKEVLGVELSFEMVQSILLGQLPQAAQKPLILAENSTYKGEFILEHHPIGFVLNSLFRLNQMSIKINNHSINAQYWQTQTSVLPKQINLHIENLQEETATHININLSGVALSSTLNFPYVTPEGYEPLNF